MSNITQMDLIKADIEYHGKGATNKDITRNILNEWRNSPKIKDMQEAFQYYLVKNTEIEKKTRDYKDEDGSIIQNNELSNIKNKTGRYRKSVNQKVNFSLEKPFVISCDDKKYKEEWDKFLNNKIRAVITRTGKDAINKGIGWTYTWINQNGDLQIVDVVPETIYPAWRDTAHTELDAVVRDYIQTYYENLTPKDIQKVEYWDSRIVEKYIDYSQGQGSSGDLVPDTNGEFELSEGLEDRATIQQTHMKDIKGNGISWDKVPFIAFKGNSDELPLLNECKSDIDAYDKLKSKSLDSLIDDIDPTIVVKSISAEMGELARARKLIQNSRIMSVDADGGASVLKVNTDISQIAQELEIIKKDIIDDTSTVDLTNIQLGTNPSGNSMKAFYESLNTWCNGFEKEFRVYMENLKYFFDKWLSWKGGFGTFEELQAIDITFTLDRDMMINESEIIDNVTKMNGIISQETLDEQNPWVESHEIEQERRDKEEKINAEKQELYQFQQDIDQNNQNSEEVNQDFNENDKNNKNNNKNEKND